MVLISEMLLYHAKEDLSNVSADGFIEGRIKPDNIAIALLDSFTGFVLEIVGESTFFQGCFVWPLSFVEFILVTGQIRESSGYHCRKLFDDRFRMVRFSVYMIFG